MFYFNPLTEVAPFELGAYRERGIVHVPNFGGLSGLEDKGGGDNSI